MGVDSYSQTLTYLFSLHRLGVQFGLERITGVLKRLHDPHLQYPTLHIGGTNGKGSTASMVSAMLQEGGYRVGLYTSPHLIDFRERIRVNSTFISQDQVCRATERIRQVLPLDTSLTFFEMTTAMAFQHFLEEQVDVAVIEVGMGGRFDATNVLDPLGILLTGVDLDHEAFLGSTLTDIAREKVEIFHAHVPVIVGPLSEDVESIVHSKATQLHAPLYRSGKEFSVVSSGLSTFSYQGLRWSLNDVTINMQGQHQMVNAGNALALLEVMSQQHLPLSPEHARAGLQRVTWKGRLEVVQKDPLILLDGAHNPSAARALFDFLQSQIHDVARRRLWMIWGMMDDKDHRGFLSVLEPLLDCLIVTQPNIARAASVDALAKVVARNDLKTICVKDPKDALALARARAQTPDLICVTGSLFLVGEISQTVSQFSSPAVRI